MSPTRCTISQPNPRQRPRLTADPLPNLAQHFLQSFALQNRNLAVVMAPRWKGKGAAAKALADPISEIVSQLQSSLIQSNSRGLLSGMSLLLKADVVQTDLLNRACFGRPRVTAENSEQWFQLCMEEAFYLYYFLNCIKIVDDNDRVQNSDEL